MTAEAGPYPCWELVECEGEVPQSRSGHTCALHKNRYLYIFGGFDGSNCFDDLYVLDLDSRHWRRIEAAGDRPSGRASHSAVADDVAGVMYIFGGSGSHFGYTNKRDLCEFSFETECWRVLSNPLEDTPSSRYGQSMVAYQEGLYVWGGTHGTNYPTDMHRFDLCSKQWNHVMTDGELPCGRYRHQAMVKDDLMYIVGGSGINRYGDVFTFHFGTCTWHKLACTGTDLSDGRYAHSAVLRENYIYLYGGNDGVRHDDLQQLDLETHVWSRVMVHGHPPPGRDFHAAVLRRDSMVIFGGSNGMRRHNDVFEFHMAPKIPPCTLSADLEALLEASQTDDVQLSCDTFLAADNGESTHGVFCHAHLLRVRCPRLYELVLDRLPPRDAPTLPGTLVGAAAAATREPAPTLTPQQHEGSVLAHSGATGDARLSGCPQETGAGAEDAPAEPTPPRTAWAAAPPTWHLHNRQCIWVPVDVPHTILFHVLRYLYAETTKFGHLAPQQLYLLLLAARRLEVDRLAILCERQIRARLGLDSVLPLLRASTQDGAAALPVQEACKHFFLANYNQCTELQECEALDPKLLCELMRLHNSRTASAMVAGCAGSQQPVQQQRGSSAGSSQLAASQASQVGQARLEDATVPRATSALLTQPSHQAPIPPSTLAQDLKRLLVEEIDPDFEVVVQDEVQSVVIPCHKLILVARSRYFASCILTSGMRESQAGRLVIPAESPMTVDAFRAFLRCLYAGDDILDILAPHIAMYLVDASSFYGLTNLRLKHFCELCVRDSFNEAHVLQLFAASSRLNGEAVRAMALEFIVSNFQTVCKRPDLEELDRHLLVDIIRGLADRLSESQTGAPQAPLAMPQSLG